MEDCRIVLECRNEKVTMRGRDICMGDLAEFAAFLLVVIGLESAERGMDREDVKGNLLELYLAAVETIEKTKEEAEDGTEKK